MYFSLQQSTFISFSCLKTFCIRYEQNGEKEFLYCSSFVQLQCFTKADYRLLRFIRQQKVQLQHILPLSSTLVKYIVGSFVQVLGVKKKKIANGSSCKFNRCAYLLFLFIVLPPIFIPHVCRASCIFLVQHRPPYPWR